MMGSQIGSSFIFKTNQGDPWSDLDVFNDTLRMVKNGILAGSVLNFDGDGIASIKMTSIEKLFDVGMTHHLIGHVRGREPIGAFVMDEVLDKNDALGKYRSLWNTNTATQRSIQISPTHKGTIHDRSKYVEVWKKRTSLFVQKNLRWTTQSLVCGTTSNNILGGNAWLGLSHRDPRVMKAFALWANSIYGMIVFWATGQRTHQGRSLLKVRAISKMKCPDFEILSDAKLQDASDFFDVICNDQMQPASAAYKDNTRYKISMFVSTMFDISDYNVSDLTKLWCDEPSVTKIVKE